MLVLLLGLLSGSVEVTLPVLQCDLVTFTRMVNCFGSGGENVPCPQVFLPPSLLMK